MIDVKAMLAKAIESGASDVHINVTMPPIMRINTELIIMDMPAVTEEMASEMVVDMVGTEKFKKLEEVRDIDFSTTIADGSRFRVNAHYQRDSIALSFRIIASEIPMIEDLHLPAISADATQCYPRRRRTTNLLTGRNQYIRTMEIRQSSGFLHCPFCHQCTIRPGRPEDCQ